MRLHAITDEEVERLLEEADELLSEYESEHSVVGVRDGESERIGRSCLPPGDGGVGLTSRQSRCKTGTVNTHQ